MFGSVVDSRGIEMSGNGVAPSSAPDSGDDSPL